MLSLALSEKVLMNRERIDLLVLPADVGSIQMGNFKTATKLHNQQQKDFRIEARMEGI